MTNQDKEKILFITARDKYATDSFRLSGYKVQRPYKDKNIFERCLRELWFRLHLPERVWYVPIEDTRKYEYIIVQDPLITHKYLEWLIKNYPEPKIVFSYCNMVGKAKHLYPKDIPSIITLWTYDEFDATKYGMNLLHSGGYSKSFIVENNKKEYDVFYVGADKGRGDYLVELERQMSSMGLNTKFIITKDGRFSKKKPYYSKRINYHEVTQYNSKSRAILNIILPDQKGATMRDYESIFNGVKLITNNKNIKKYDFYKKRNVFILGEDDFHSLKNFINSPYQKLEDDILEKHTLDEMIKEMIL